MTFERFDELLQYKRFFNRLLPDLGEHNIMMKMLDLDNVCLFARLGSEIYGGCVFTPHYDVNGKGQGEFIELHYLGVD